MRKIDKTIHCSTAYRDWEAQLEAQKQPHPAYNSSNGMYYKDIVMELLRCQGGICAYTEVHLCSQEALNATMWENGCYSSKIKENNGALEHFDESLKYKSGDPQSQQKDWLWSNFFVVDSDTNTRKGTKPVDYILKPDSDDYDPFRLLAYSPLTGFYQPNSNLPDVDKDRVKSMIDTLGINFPALVDKRKRMVEAVDRYGNNVFEPEFPTAFAFYERYRNATSALV